MQVPLWQYFDAITECATHVIDIVEISAANKFGTQQIVSRLLEYMKPVRDIAFFRAD